MPKVSVIIPVYNVEQYLERCLDSVINQTLKDIEIICVDDCSTDNSLEILTRYAKDDSRIKVVALKENKKQGYARNKALKVATSEYIGFIDSDDEIELNYYEKLYNKAKETNSDIACANIVAVKSDKINKAVWLREGKNDGQKLCTIFEKLKRVYENSSTSPCKHIYKAELLKNSNIGFSEGCFHEDQLFNIKAYYFANQVILENENSPVYKYFMRDGSTTRQDLKSPRYKKFFFDQLFVIQEIIGFLKLKKIDNVTKAVLLKDFEQIVTNLSNKINEHYLMEFLAAASKLELNKEFIKKLKKDRNKVFLQKIFSVKNEIRPNKKYKVVSVFGVKLKFGFNIDKLLCILKPKNIRVRRNSILLVEVNDIDHAEVLPGYAKYLLDLGYNVDVVLTENNYRMNSLCRIKDKNLRVYPIKRYFFGKFFNSSLIKKYSKIFFTSYITYYSIGSLSSAELKLWDGRYVTIFEHFPVLNKYRNKIYTVEHHLDLADKELLKNKHVISLAKFDTQDKNFTMVNPNYFGEVKNTNKNEKITKFITIGTFFVFRKNTELLTKTVRLLKEQGFDNFEICAIGQYKPQDFSSDDFKNINFMGRVSADIVYDKLEQADFFLPMLDPENPDHDRYITTGTSGSFQLIYGFNKPCLISEKFAKPHYFDKNNSVVYKTNSDFIEAIKQAINMNPEDYRTMQKNLTKTTDKIRTESMQNLKEILKT
ncbi:MAG: glycosyltransferase [Candidatus Gastranaerophilales bacterium]|nr:glycosyltransferase [Candidatus Gastranaerophilales bacterium]